MDDKYKLLIKMKNGDKLEFITDKITIQKLMICVKRRDNLSKKTMFN